MNRRSYDLMKGKPRETTCQWSSQSYSLQGITSSFSLPMVIKSDVPSCSLDGQDFKLKLSEQPILLYSTRTKTKMVARHLQYDRDQGILDRKKTGGEKLIIPEDYPGWFVYLKSATDGVKCLESISDVSSSRVKAFVTGSNLTGLQVTNHTEGRVEYKQRHFLPGTVFRTDRIYVGKIRVQVGMKFFFFRKTKLQDVKYLKCYDVQNREILLSLGIVGKFFEILPLCFEGSDKEKYVFNNEELFARRQLLSPIMLIYGQLPRVENFSGILHIQRKFVDETVVAATSVGRHQPIVLEIAVSSASTFHLALNSKDVIRHGEMGAVLKHCKRKGEQFVQRIRVPFAMSQKEIDETQPAPNETVIETDAFETESNNTLRRLDSITETIEDDINHNGPVETADEENGNSNNTVTVTDNSNVDEIVANGPNAEPLQDITNVEISTLPNKENSNTDLDDTNRDENANDTDILGINSKAVSATIDDDENVCDTAIIDDDENVCDTATVDDDENVCDTATVDDDENVCDTATIDDDENVCDTALLIKNDSDNESENQICEYAFEKDVCIKDESSDSCESADDSFEHTYTVIEEEKLINLNTMSEVIVNTTTTTTTTTTESVPVESAALSEETSENSDDSDSEREKMSEVGDSEDSGISENNKSHDTTRL